MRLRSAGEPITHTYPERCASLPSAQAARATIAGMARDLRPFDYALYLMGEFTLYLEDRADELSGDELASLQERLAHIAHELQALRATRTAS